MPFYLGKSQIGKVSMKQAVLLQEKTVTPTTSEQRVTADENHHALSAVNVEAVKAATQATPVVSVSSSGLITASAEQEEGYVSAGTKSATEQLPVQTGKTVTPSTSEQTAVSSGKFTTGDVVVAGDANLKAENIAEGVSIFGVVGRHSGGDDDAFISVIERTVTELTLPAGVTKIGTYAFRECANLVMESLPSTITSINSYAFYGCSNLALTSLPSGITNISSYAFQNCSKLALTSLPSGITKINTYAFYSCSKLALTTLPSNVTSIDTNAFRYCYGLAQMTIPSGVTTLGNYAFANCTGLTKVTFKGTPTSISTNAFATCSKLKTINVPWVRGAVANAPWGASSATINYDS